MSVRACHDRHDEERYQEQRAGSLTDAAHRR
jgi:hypothetical protein